MLFKTLGTIEIKSVINQGGLQISCGRWANQDLCDQQGSLVDLMAEVQASGASPVMEVFNLYSNDGKLASTELGSALRSCGVVISPGDLEDIVTGGPLFSHWLMVTVL